jgi:hypothetical protein
MLEDYENRLIGEETDIIKCLFIHDERGNLLDSRELLRNNAPSEIMLAEGIYRDVEGLVSSQDPEG